MQMRSRIFMKRKFVSFLCLTLVASLPLISTSAFGFGESVEGSSEALFWSAPQTVHDFQKSTDIHGMITSAMAITELEVVRLIDKALNFPIRKDLDLLEKIFDWVRHSYHRIPQVKPIRRVGQLVDALLIEELSLADIRSLANASSSEGGGGITPMMQARVYRVLVWAEHIIDDLDQALLFPADFTFSQILDRDVHPKLLGYGADGLSLVRERVFMILRIVNKKLVKLGSKVINRVEDVQNAWIGYRRTKKNNHYSIHLRVPLSEYETSTNFPESEATHKDITFIDHVNGVAIDPATVELNEEMLAPVKIDRAALDTKYFLTSIEIDRWKNVDSYMRRYVIDEDEYDHLHLNSR